MGSFGLSDYLRQRGIEARILNLSLYPPGEMRDVLDRCLNTEFQPTHAGLVFHWQETAEGFLWAGEYIRDRRPDMKIIAGGFSAGYFGENLLEKCRFLDYVLRGDPEKPLELLLQGTEVSRIPNLIHRQGNNCTKSAVHHTDCRILSRISFTDLTCLYDHERYVKAIEKKLGFPVFLGRGCRHACDYCGGSRRAFTLHSRSAKPITREIGSVIADLKRLKQFTRTIYICYENDLTYLKDLFRAIQKEPELVKTFLLNYGAWNLFDREFLDLYREVFICSSENKPVFELSPEVYNDGSRRKIKHNQGHYSVRELGENIEFLDTCLGDTVRISVFFSRYHDTMKTYGDIRREICGISRFTHEVVRKNLCQVQVNYGHLSTDIGSRYWERYVDNPRDFDSLISGIRMLRIQEQTGFPFDNLCLYIPKTLTKEEIFSAELLVFILRTLERSFFEMFHILFACLQEVLIEVIEEIIHRVYRKREGNVFRNLDHTELLNCLKTGITGNLSRARLVPFAEDLITLNRKKAQCMRRSSHLMSGYQTRRPRLNQAFISVHNHDYLDLQAFLKKLQKGSGALIADMTVYIFLADEIMSMTYDTYKATIEEFGKGISVDEYYQVMERKQIFTRTYHEQLVAQLFRDEVLY